MAKSVRSPEARKLVRLLSLTGALACLGLSIFIGCGGGFNPIGFTSPGTTDNDPPRIDVIEPNEDLPISRGESFIVRWTDSDPDDNALIDIDLIEVDGVSEFKVAGGIRENDNSGPDLFVVDTGDIPEGTYFVQLKIDDGKNLAVVDFAEDSATGNRVQITITPAGLGTQNSPPRVFVASPQINAGVSQNDVLTITIRPTVTDLPVGAPDPGPALHYDQDGDPVDVTILLDLDDDPTNDDFESDDDPGNIILERELIAEGFFDPINFTITIDVQDIPVRRDGLPYLIKVVMNDGLNTTFSYASGRLHVLELVEGSSTSSPRVIDLSQIGRTLAGVRFLGFNPRANLGTKMESALDQDGDGIGDFILVAQYGNPRNRGNIGEAYLIYGNSLRFGGDININSVGAVAPATSFNRVRGSVFQPHKDFIFGGVIDLAEGDDLRIREMNRTLDQPYTLGITDVATIRNIGGTGGAADACAIPELLFGLAHNEYLSTTDDYDPDDDQDGFFGCYPDNLANNFSNDTPDDDPGFNIFTPVEGFFAHEEKMGTVAIYYGENSISAIGDAADVCGTLIAPTPSVLEITSCGAQGPGGRGHFHAGARINVGIFDNIGNFLGDAAPFPVDPLNAHFGMNVAVLPDIDLNGLDEIIISAPRNELAVAELVAQFGESHPHLASRLSRFNITLFLGQDFAGLTARADGTAHIPWVTTRSAPPPRCGNDPVPRFLETQYDTFGVGANHPDPANNVTVSPGYFFIRGEKPSDKLGGATSAGDFNLDGPADILCGAPFADPKLDLDPSNGSFPDTTIEDAGTVYVVYMRLPFGTTALILADITQFPLSVRPPMLRIFGEGRMDHLGLKQESGADVNGDSIDDIFIASKDYNGLGMVNNGFIGIVFGGQSIDGDRTVSQIATTELRGTRFYGTHTGDLAGADLSPAGDFNQDGLGDLLISAPGELVAMPGEDKPRRGVVYLIFGGRHLENQVFTLNQVGTAALPGIVMVGPYQQDTLEAFELDQPIFVREARCDPTDDIECLCDPEVDEACVLLEDNDGTFELRRVDDAAPERVGFIGDVNGDGFDDIMIGNPTADFVDPTLPGLARRPDAGEAYLIYGNNFGANTVILSSP